MATAASDRGGGGEVTMSHTLVFEVSSLYVDDFIPPIKHIIH